MISDEQFEAAGYQRWQSGVFRLNHSDYLYQKKVEGRNGETLYFINCWVYLPRHDGHGGITAESEMYQEEDRHAPHFTIQMHNPNDIKLMEEFFSRAYRKLEMIPDVHNN